MRKEQTGSKSRCLNRACHAHDSCVGRCACGGTQIQITNAPKSTHLLGENREKKELLPLHFVSRRKNREREERCLCASLPCPVLQYADDTLILVRGDVASMCTLKTILDDFSLATGLYINFHKSTFVPMNVSDQVASAMATALGCAQSSFPQTYLGLPISPHKLRVADFQPLIASG